MAALEVLALNTTVPRIEAPQAGDTYTFPRAADVPLGTALLPAVAFTGDLNTGVFSPTADTFAVATGGTERLRVDSAGDLLVGTTQGSLGGRVRVVDSLRVANAATETNALLITTTGSTATIETRYGTPLVFGTNGTERMRLDAGGNLGLGVTPSAWGGSYKAVNVVGSGSLFSNNQFNTRVGNNVFHNGTNFVYDATGFAAYYSVNDAAGRHAWFIAPSGTAGTAISFTQAMTLDASGNLGIGVTPSAWASGYKVAQVGLGGAIFSDAATFQSFSVNHYIASGGDRYRANGRASLYVQGAGTHVFYSAGNNTSGADAVLTWAERIRIDVSGNLGLGTATFGTSAATVFSIANGTEPSTGPADTVQFFSVDRSAGNTIPGIYCEGTGVTDAAITNVTVTNKIAIKVNGTVYYLLATTSAA